MKQAGVQAGIALFFIIAISRLPFLDAGYGANIDAWRLARAARKIAETRSYEVSRFPGYPVHEVSCAVVSTCGPVVLNSLSAAFGLIASAVVWQIACRLHCRDPLLVSAAFAFTPIIFVSSVTSKDYIWAIGFSLSALLAAIDRRAILSGVLLGFAIGCRITSGAMLLPIAMIIAGHRSKRSIVYFVVAAGVTGTEMFLPVWLRYGSHFLTFYDNHARPDFQTIVERGTVEVWGVIGLTGLLVAVLLQPIVRRKWEAASLPAASNQLLIPALVITVVLYIIAYLRLPDQAGYLCPIVAPILFLLARFVSRPLFQTACAAVLLGWWSPVMADHRDRVQAIRDVNRFVTATEAALPGGNTIVVGSWEPIISMLHPESHNKYVYLLSQDQAEQLVAMNQPIAYTSEIIRQFNYRATGLDLASVGARDIRAMLLGKP